MPRMRPELPTGTAPRLRELFRPARNPIRLRADQKIDQSRKDRYARSITCGAIENCLPIDGEPRVGLYSGFTPLVRAQRLGAALGVKQLYIKDDSVNHPTFSYKDRVVAVAISKAMEFGFDTVACASTGNLANSVAAHAAVAGSRLLRVHSRRLEPAKNHRFGVFMDRKP